MRAAETALQSFGRKKSDHPRIPNPDEELKTEPMSLIPREDRERREDLERKKPPSPEGETREVRMADDQDRELNSLTQMESSKTALNVIWATVDSGAATSCLPVQMCKKNLTIEGTSDLPYTMPVEHL